MASRTEMYARCGVMGHAWFEYENYTWKPEFGTPLVLRCERCGTERHDSVSPVDGQLVARSYQYPAGYKYAKGERPSMPDFRLALLTLRDSEARKKKRQARASNVIEMKKADGA